MQRSFFVRLRKDGCRKTRGLLSAYVDDYLSPRERERVTQHLAECEACREELALLRATVQLLNRVPQATPLRSFAVAEPKPVPRRAPLPVLRTAVAITAALAVFLLVAQAVNLFETGTDSTGNEGVLSSPSGADEGRGSKDSEGPGNDGRSPAPPPAPAPTPEDAGAVTVFTPNEEDWVVVIRGDEESVAACLAGNAIQGVTPPPQPTYTMSELYGLLSSGEGGNYEATDDVVLACGSLDMEQLSKIVESPSAMETYSATAGGGTVVIPLGSVDMEALWLLAESENEEE